MEKLNYEMKKDPKKVFSFLSDERAVAEIRKHKWLESQKANQEIGFATAAIDWIKRFGEAWKRFHLKQDKDYDLLFERRRFRRYKIDSDIKLNKDDSCISVKAKELSFSGILCYSKEYIPASCEVTMRFNFEAQGKDERSYIKCKGTVNRVIPFASEGYEIFLRFDETGKRYVEDSLLVS